MRNEFLFASVYNQLDEQTHETIRTIFDFSKSVCVSASKIDTAFEKFQKKNFNYVNWYVSASERHSPKFHIDGDFDKFTTFVHISECGSDTASYEIYITSSNEHKDIINVTVMDIENDFEVIESYDIPVSTINSRTYLKIKKSIMNIIQNHIGYDFT